MTKRSLKQEAIEELLVYFITDVTPPTPQNISRHSTTANNQTEAYIFPPLCVVLVFTEGDKSKFSKIFHSIFSLVGTLAYIPSVIHALYWVFYDIERSQIEQSQD
ncbi:6556_t:CDS:2 [Cetraspora pellucida]|uniref:6556_t:CDS:1 n=1 Tax=Cetraspora pellucida TaxID=1433469 RepID=A0ACA9LFG8_9GLOM|nr:6556_t:CDS:2 [Cetraspora pellucida]